ncbi:unnamed protein product [Closterium sp. Yama58-4]|nr:unnamed protein product [Closterium sp. Yama58-4]
MCDANQSPPSSHREGPRPRAVQNVIPDSAICQATNDFRRTSAAATATENRGEERDDAEGNDREEESSESQGASAERAKQEEQEREQQQQEGEGQQQGGELKRPTTPLPCPRCKSLATKFCYFNNYNPNQPRHFCRACQRYWTAGGNLRNVPVGSGRRKSKVALHPQQQQGNQQHQASHQDAQAQALAPGDPAAGVSPAALLAAAAAAAAAATAVHSPAVAAANPLMPGVASPFLSALPGASHALSVPSAALPGGYGLPPAALSPHGAAAAALSPLPPSGAAIPQADLLRQGVPPYSPGLSAGLSPANSASGSTSPPLLHQALVASGAAALPPTSATVPATVPATAATQAAATAAGQHKRPLGSGGNQMVDYLGRSPPEQQQQLGVGGEEPAAKRLCLGASGGDVGDDGKDKAGQEGVHSRKFLKANPVAMMRYMVFQANG